jgi:hypothetical protein
MPEETKPAPAKKAGLDKNVKHMGTFTTFRGVEMPCYLQFQDVEGPLRGFAVIDAKTHKELKPGLRVMSTEHFEPARLKVKLSGKTEPVK